MRFEVTNYDHFGLFHVYSNVYEKISPTINIVYDQEILS
jgi:hypothetical protein